MLVGYAPVSTEDQSADWQLDALKGAGCGRIVEDKAFGPARERPRLAEALDAIRKGDTLVVWKLDRLAQDLKQLVETVERLEHAGIGFKSLTEDIDTTTPHGKLMLHVFCALAEFERQMNRERTKAGLAAARARGRVGGRPRALSESDIAAARAMLADSAISVAEVARRLNVSPATLYRHLPGGRSGIQT